MTNRYALRFETGERRGETVPITGETFTVGRRPGNSIQIVENSVSGQHAELSAGPQGLALKDLGSTNGTRLNGERVLETNAPVGSEIAFGNVLMTVLDADAPSESTPLPAAVPQPAPSRAQLEQPTAMHDASELDLHVSAENLARSKKGSKGILVVLVVIIAAGAGAYAYFQQSGGGAAPKSRAVEAPADNLLARGYSFEGESDPFSALEAPGVFVRDESAARSGENGVSADLEAGAWALHSSAGVRAQANKEYTNRGYVRMFGDARARLGLEFSNSLATAARPVRAFSSSLAESTGFELVEWSMVAPAGFDTVRALVWVRATEGGAGGGCDVDDVSLSVGGMAAPTATSDEYKFYGLGSPAHAGVLFKVDRVLASGFEFGPLGVREPVAPITIESAENGVRISATDIDGAAECRLTVAPEQMAGGIGIITDAGYTLHSVDFTQSNVTDVLVGRGLDLVRLRSGEPCTVVGRAGAAGFALTLQIGSARTVLLQLAFRDERAQAVTLAGHADDAESQAHLGECLALWQQLLNEFPYEDGLVARAEETRGRLIRLGLDEVRALGARVERARFFRLIDLFRQCRAEADSIGSRYAGSEVEERARELQQEIDAELVALETDLDKHEVERLEAIRVALGAEGAELLAAEVERYLNDNFGGQR